MRTGLMKYVDRIFTCSEVAWARQPHLIYEMAAEFMGTRLRIHLYSRTLSCGEAAQNGGFVVVGLYDESSRDGQEIL
ncbi:MAG: hypothetical protein ACLTDF_12785 [Coprococcus sp.]